jgi:TetR/AcrR family transcriptional regulator
MSKPVASKAVPGDKRIRRTQERAEITRSKLLEAATVAFSERGYDGVSVRDIENKAGVKRGLLGYHFGDKKTIWIAIVDNTFGLMKTAVNKRMELLQDLGGRDRLAYIIRFFTRFAAKHPEMSQLMGQEARQDSWRIRYLVDTHIAEGKLAMEIAATETLGLDKKAFIHWYYIMVSGSATIFSFAPECKLLFGEDPRAESVVETHAEMMVSMLLGNN